MGQFFFTTKTSGFSEIDKSKQWLNFNNKMLMQYDRTDMSRLEREIMKIYLRFYFIFIAI